jgi:hypothetical protein
MLWPFWLGKWRRYRNLSSDACGAEIKDLEGYPTRIATRPGRGAVVTALGTGQVLSIIRMTVTHCHWELGNGEVIEHVNSTGVNPTHWEAVR